MLRFYGLECHESQVGKVIIQKSKEFSERKWEWIHLCNHNYLRITRILKCLMLFGLQDEAQSFYDCLCQVYQENRDRIGDDTFQYWTNAVKTDATISPTDMR